MYIYFKSCLLMMQYSLYRGGKTTAVLRQFREDVKRIVPLSKEILWGGNPQILL